MSTVARVLRLLSLLQGQRFWTGNELAEQLGVDIRTVRRDIERLRELDYTVQASSGPGGGYRLGPGRATPPFQFEDEEAVAVAASLTAASGGLAGVEDVALRVLVKLDRLMPGRLKGKLGALRAVTMPLEGHRPPVDPVLLTNIAAACQERDVLRFSYTSVRNDVTERVVEPVRLAHTGRVWYLIAWDRHREDWRTFRIDRIDAGLPLLRGPRFPPRALPDEVAADLSHSPRGPRHRHMVTLRLAASIGDARGEVPSWIGVLEPLDGSKCTLTIGADSYEAIASRMMLVGVPFVVQGPPEAREPLGGLTRRLLAAIEGGPEAQR